MQIVNLLVNFIINFLPKYISVFKFIPVKTFWQCNWWGIHWWWVWGPLQPTMWQPLASHLRSLFLGFSQHQFGLSLCICCVLQPTHSYLLKCGRWRLRAFRAERLISYALWLILLTFCCLLPLVVNLKISSYFAFYLKGSERFFCTFQNCVHICFSLHATASLSGVLRS